MHPDHATTYIAYQEGIPHDEVPEWLDQWAETIEGKTAGLATNLKTFFSRGITVNFDLDHHDKEPTVTNETFTPSNGVTVTIDDNGYLLATTDDGMCHATGGAALGVQALREYFTHERDQELGRWRDPENTNIVVYRVPENDNKGGRAVRVIDEATGTYASLWERDVKHFERGSMHATAARYFEQHPEPGKQPRPLPDREQVARTIRQAIDNPREATWQMDLDAADAVLDLFR